MTIWDNSSFGITTGGIFNALIYFWLFWYWILSTSLSYCRWEIASRIIIKQDRIKNDFIGMRVWNTLDEHKRLNIKVNAFRFCKLNIQNIYIVWIIFVITLTPSCVNERMITWNVNIFCATDANLHVLSHVFASTFSIRDNINCIHRIWADSYDVNRNHQIDKTCHNCAVNDTCPLSLSIPQLLTYGYFVYEPKTEWKRYSIFRNIFL